jgi:phenylacetate-CoA ligase
MTETWKPRSYILDLWLTRQQGREAIARKQSMRIASLVDYARTQSRYYGQLYEHIPHDAPLEALPAVTKKELMAHFDQWITDDEATEECVEAFMSDSANIGKPFLGRYRVAHTSGSIGIPGVILQDQPALALYQAINTMRGWPEPATLLGWATGYLRYGWRMAAISGIGGHHGNVVALERIRRRYPWLRSRMQHFSLYTPVPELVDQLNAYQPTQLILSTAIARVLANTQRAGALHIHPVAIFVVAETLRPEARAEMESGFGCRVIDAYTANEFEGMAFQCRNNRLHLNTDWLVLEPVDREYRPVPPGVRSYSALLTNLANRVQPLIRYEMGDSITFYADDCKCGSPFPSLRVEGRTSEVLGFTTAEGHVVEVPWSVFESPLFADSALERYQVIQVGPYKLRMRLAIRPGLDEDRVWEDKLQAARDLLVKQGLPNLEVVRAAEPPQINPNTGKYARVWRDFE